MSEKSKIDCVHVSVQIGGRELCCTRQFDALELRDVGVVINAVKWACGSIVNYIREKNEWDRKSDFEKGLLILHDARKGYAGGAPAGRPDIACGVQEKGVTP